MATNPNPLLNKKDSADLLGVSKRKFELLRREPWFPTACVLGPRTYKWRRDELLAAVSEHTRGTKQSEPVQLASARAARKEMAHGT